MYGTKTVTSKLIKKISGENTFYNKTLSATVALVYFIFEAVAQKMCNIFSKIKIFNCVLLY